MNVRTHARTAGGGRLGRIVPLAGAGSAVLTVAAYLVIGPNPDSDASTATIRAYYAAHHAHVFVAGNLLAYAAVLFAVFGVAVWARMRQAPMHPVVAGTALAATAVATVSDLTSAGGWYVLGDLGGKQTISSGALQALHVSVAAASLPAAAGVGLLLIAFAAAGIGAHAFPRWLAWTALVIGVLQLVPTPGAIGFLSGLAVLPWMLVAGIVMSVRPAGTDPGAAHGAPPAAVAGRALAGS
jgi:hypothetical protein